MTAAARMQAPPKVTIVDHTKRCKRCGAVLRWRGSIEVGMCCCCRNDHTGRPTCSRCDAPLLDTDTDRYACNTCVTGTVMHA